MGYTHYWSINPNDPTLIAAWPQLVEDAQKIAQAADKGEINGVVIETNGVPLADWDGKAGSTPQFTETEIGFNGVGEDSHENFRLSLAPEFNRRVAAGDEAFTWAFCKTARKPYDVVVCAILLRAVQLAPSAIVVGSDGSWDDEWLNGAWDGVLGARPLVADLFGTDKPDLDFEVNSTAGPQAAWGVTA